MKYQERNIKLLKYLQLSIQPSWNLLCNYEEWLAADYKLNSELFICFAQKVSYGGEHFTEAADVLSMHQPNTSSRTCDRSGPSTEKKQTNKYQFIFNNPPCKRNHIGVRIQFQPAEFNATGYALVLVHEMCVWYIRTVRNGVLIRVRQVLNAIYTSL